MGERKWEFKSRGTGKSFRSAFQRGKKEDARNASSLKGKKERRSGKEVKVGSTCQSTHGSNKCLRGVKRGGVI